MSVVSWAHVLVWGSFMATAAQGGAGVPPIQLECPVGGCELGEDGGGYKTPLLPSGEALKLLTLHTQFNHVQSHGGAAGQQQQGDGGARVGCKAEKVPRPVLKKGQSEDKFLHFSRQWAR